MCWQVIFQTSPKYIRKKLKWMEDKKMSSEETMQIKELLEEIHDKVIIYEKQLLAELSDNLDIPYENLIELY